MSGIVQVFGVKTMTQTDKPLILTELKKKYNKLKIKLYSILESDKYYGENLA